jgi:hypothetical protein
LLKCIASEIIGIKFQIIEKLINRVNVKRGAANK